MQSENAADLARLFFIVAGKLWRIQQTSNINNLTCLRFIEMVVTRMVAFKLGREGGLAEMRNGRKFQRKCQEKRVEQFLQ